MLTTIHLVRHGEVHNPDHVVYADLEGFGLSVTGRAQAEAAARRLHAERVGLVVTSPLRRAVETADRIAHALGVEPITEAGLREWMLARRWAGVVWEELPKRFPGEMEAYLATPADLPFTPEPLTNLAERVTRVIADLERRHTDDTAVLVSHQDPIQAARLTLTGRPLAHLQSEKPGHASIVTLRRTGDGWSEASYWEPDEPSAPFPPVEGPQGT